LIQEQLPALKNPPLIFGSPLPERTLGFWTLKEAQQLYYSSETSSSLPLGEAIFVEDKTAPSRAYLKLWEYFTVTGRAPRAGETCIDLGSSPGGWTWVLSNLGCQVISVDKAPLTEELQADPRIRKLKKDAFQLKPEDIGPVDWLFSDIICYPHKLLDLVHMWMSSGLVKNFVCTIKFQGETDFASLKAFQNIPGSEIRHLTANKHEVTWSLLDKKP
jgi:23S rRNA (cytidine2498-2'-O)-methyltransferase